MLEEAVSVSVGETDRKRKDSSERVIEPYAQVVHSPSADKRTVSRVCLVETVSLGGYIWSLGQVYPVGSYTRARM